MEMKAPALALVLAFAGLQTVAVADCCCGVVCKQRDAACSDCGHETKPAPARPDC
jgi:hypothetical protein